MAVENLAKNHVYLVYMSLHDSFPVTGPKRL